jgi:dolichol-phosphate mannosyltransferase
VYNVGTGRQTSLADLVALARSVMGIAEEPRWGTFPDREWDSTVWLADVRKIEAELGWKAALDLRAGLAETVEWFRSTPHHEATYAVSRS